MSGFSRTIIVVSGFSRTMIVVSGFSRTTNLSERHGRSGTFFAQAAHDAEECSGARASSLLPLRCSASFEACASEGARPLGCRRVMLSGAAETNPCGGQADSSELTAREGSGGQPAHERRAASRFFRIPGGG